MISFNKDGSIKLPDYLEVEKVGTRGANLRYEQLYATAKGKQIKVLFLVENPVITKNIYSDSSKDNDNPIFKLFDAFGIKTNDINAALEALLNKGYFIMYLEKDKQKTQSALKVTLIELKPENIVVIGDQFDKHLGFIREESRFIDEKIELDDNFAEKIKLLTKKTADEGKQAR